MLTFVAVISGVAHNAASRLDETHNFVSCLEETTGLGSLGYVGPVSLNGGKANGGIVSHAVRVVK